MKCRRCEFECDTLGEMNAHAAADHAEERAAERAARKNAPAKKRTRTRSRVKPPTSEPAGVTDTATAPAGELVDTGERAPLDPGADRPTWRDRLWRAKKERDNDPTPAPRRERRPKVKRVSTAKTITMMYSGAGFMLARSGADVPVGRVLQFQAPAAGEILEELTRDTFLDRPLQFVASRAETAEKAGALLGLPLLVFMYERASDDLATVIEPMLREAVRQQFVNMVPVVKKAREDERKWREAVSELGLEGADPIGDLLGAIFERPGPDTGAEAPADVPTEGAA